MANQFYLAQAAWLTVSSNVVNTSIARAAYVAELAATESLVGLEQQQLRLAEEGERTGYLAYAAVLALRGQLSTTLATRAPLRQKISAADHLLATLQGITPADQALPEVTLEELVLPHDLPLTLPAVLLRQRPDVLSAEATLHASNAAIGVATAALFPQITLDGSGGMAASRFAGLSQAGQRYWTIGPSLSLPLFNGGILHAQLDAAHQTEQQSEALYRQTVLAALAQVADVLAALTHDAEALQALADAQADACAALALLQSGYATGLVAWSDVLVSDGQCRQAAIARIEAVAQRQQDSVALFMALGGGWWNDEERNRALLQDASGPPATGGVP
jgi:NodT family efflux transporter outer membrane factor (OMF) lipoprotein